MSNRAKAQQLADSLDQEGPPTPDDLYELIRSQEDLRQDTKESALDVIGQLQSDLTAEEWVDTFPEQPKVFRGAKHIQIEVPIQNGIGPDKPLPGAEKRIYYWAHGTTPDGAVHIVQDRRVLRTLESSNSGEPTWGFFGMATEDSSADALRAIIQKARSIGKGAYGLIFTGFLVTPVQHEKVSAGGNIEDQEACYRCGISHRVGTHWCMREDLCTVTGVTITSSLPIDKQEHVPLFRPLSTGRT